MEFSRETMKRVLITVLGTLLAGWLLILCSSCYRSIRDPGATRTTEDEQRVTAVAVAITCGNGIHAGSGVIIDGERVLSAYHVVECETPKSAVYVLDVSGTVTAMEIEFASKPQDVVQLKRKRGDGKRWPITPPRYGVAVGGMVVCDAAMHPVPSYNCGTVQRTSLVQTDSGTRELVLARYNSTPGNSGSGVYNSLGQLVGIHVVQTRDNTMSGYSPIGKVPWIKSN